MISAPTSTAISQAVSLLSEGDVVAVPTETVYGLAADAFNLEGVAKIFATKKRPHFDPLIVHVDKASATLAKLSSSGIIAAEFVTTKEHTVAEKLISEFWPGPLTILLPKGPKIDDLVTSGLSHVAVRAPAHPILQKIIAELGHPIAAPSANLFGRVSPTTAQHVADDFGDDVPLIIDGGSCVIGVESTIVAINSDGTLSIVRHGGIGASRFLNAGFKIAKSAAQYAAPGTLNKHYAPNIPLCWFSDLSILCERQPKLMTSPRPIVLLKTDSISEKAAQEILTLFPEVNLRSVDLTIDGDSNYAAQNLFKKIREFERAKLAAIIVSDITLDDGLWPAIKDRIHKARNHWIT